MPVINISENPRSDDEIVEALSAIRRDLVTGKPVPVMAFYPTILDALEELFERRNQDS